MRAHVLLLALSVVLRGSTGGLDEKDVTEAAVAVAANEEGDDEDDWNLTKEILQLTKISLDLDVAFFTPWGLDESQFDYLQIFRDEPESVIVAKTMDHEHCLVEFRASVPGSKADSEIDNKPGIREICREDEGGDVLVTQTSSCCKVRLGYYEAYHASFLPEMEESIRACTSRCERSDCPVVLSGFSQGGGIASVAAIFLAHLNPLVIVKGQPAAIVKPCTLIDSNRFYRFINTNPTRIFFSWSNSITYDQIAFKALDGTSHFGHMVLLSDDSTGVAYIGKDANDQFEPTSLAPHLPISLYDRGYRGRINALLRRATDPVRDTGYRKSFGCSQDKECESKRCVRGNWPFRKRRKCG